MTGAVVASLIIIAVSLVVAGLVGLQNVRESRQALRAAAESVRRIANAIEPLREEGQHLSAAIARLSDAAERREEALAGINELRIAGSRVSGLAGLVKAVVDVKKAVSGGVPAALGGALLEAFTSQRRMKS